MAIAVTDHDIDAREAEILGKPQRIEPLHPDEFDEEATALVVAVRGSLAVHSMAQIPEVFGVMLKHPGLFRCQMEMSVQLLGRGELSRRERELAIMRCGWLCRAPYEWGQHVEIAKRYGVPTEDVERVTRGPDAEGWSRHERAVLAAVDELLADQYISDGTWDVLAESWSERQLLEFPMLIGIYYMTALQQNSLRVRLANGNRGLRQR